MHMNVKDSIWGLHELSGFWHYLAAFAVMSRDKRPLILSLLCLCLSREVTANGIRRLLRAASRKRGRSRSVDALCDAIA